MDGQIIAVYWLHADILQCVGYFAHPRSSRNPAVSFSAQVMAGGGKKPSTPLLHSPLELSPSRELTLPQGGTDVRSASFASSRGEPRITWI